MRIPRALLDEITEHARRDAPNECCGLIATKDGELVTYYPIRNEYESPMRFRFHSADLPAVYERAEDRGERLDVVYHSHPRSEAYPSQTDVNIARQLGDWFPTGQWVICSLAEAEPVVRAFKIQDGAVSEVELVVDG